MSTLALQRCLHHVMREAVARCPECGHSYCRECIVEHEERVVCANCLKKILSKASQKRNFALQLLQVAHLSFSFLLLWIVFFAVGCILLAILSSFHEGDF